MTRLLNLSQTQLVILAGLALFFATLADATIGTELSLSVLYLVPMVVAALVFRPAQIVAAALTCACLPALFDRPAAPGEAVLRFVFAAVAYAMTGLFVRMLMAQRRLVVHSPVAMISIGTAGRVLEANGLADELFGLRLHGRSIEPYLPLLTAAAGNVGLRTTMECQAHRHNGEIFLARTWLSTYPTPNGTRLDALIVDASEEMREREAQGLLQVSRGNRIATAVIAHEVRNVTQAMRMLCGELRDGHDLGQDESLRGLDTLAMSLESIAQLELHHSSQDEISAVSLREILDNLRVITEPAWREIDGTIRWTVPSDVPMVFADAGALLQTFLNLARNSHRAAESAPRRELNITARRHERRVYIEFQDLGGGVANPAVLFQPFQEGASGTGLGLYASRYVLRSYGGDLRYIPGPEGSLFRVELDAAEQESA